MKVDGYNQDLLELVSMNEIGRRFNLDPDTVALRLKAAAVNPVFAVMDNGRATPVWFDCQMHVIGDALKGQGLKELLTEIVEMDRAARTRGKTGKRHWNGHGGREARDVFYDKLRTVKAIIKNSGIETVNAAAEGLEIGFRLRKQLGVWWS